MIDLIFPDQSVRSTSPPPPAPRSPPASRSRSPRRPSPMRWTARCATSPTGRAGREARDPDARRPARAGAHPPRHGARAGRGGAGAVAGHAGDDRSRDRERLLLRLRQGDAVHAGRPAGDREEDGGDHPPQRALHQGGLVARGSAPRVRREGRDLQGSARRRDPRGAGPQDLPPGRLVRPLPRSAHGLDGPDRRGVQADEGRGRLLARRFEQPDADAHLRHGLGDAGAAEILSPHAGGSREARPPPPRPRDGPLPLPGRGAGRRVLAPEGLVAVPGPGGLHAPPPEGRLRRGERAAGAGQVALGKRPATGAGTARTCSRCSRPATRRRTSACSRSSR